MSSTNYKIIQLYKMIDKKKSKITVHAYLIKVIFKSYI